MLRRKSGDDYLNIMLFSDMPPCNNFTGGLILKQLVEFLLEEKHNVCCYAVLDKTLNPEISQNILNKMPYRVFDKPIEYWGAQKYGFFKSLYMNNYISAFKLPKIAEDVSSFGKLHNVDLIWSVVQGQTMIKLVRRVARTMQKPYTVQVWDPPEWWLKEFKFDKLTALSVMKEFNRMLRDSKTCLAASWAMADAYSKLYRAKCIPVIPGLPETDLETDSNREDDDFIIGFAGQVYAKEEFEALIEALEYMNWKYEDRKIRMRLFGHDFSFNDPTHIQLCGYLEQKELFKHLKNADLLYCPYFFSKEYDFISRLSFPSKLTSYLSIKKPVLFHGPEFSSPCIFLKENDAGYICSTMDSLEIAEYLRYVIGDSMVSKSKAENGYKAYKKYLTSNAMKTSFFNALGLERGEDLNESITNK